MWKRPETYISRLDTLVKLCGARNFTSSGPLRPLSIARFSAISIYRRSYATGHRRTKSLLATNGRDSNGGKLKKLTFVIPDFISVNKLANLLNCRVQTLVRDLKQLGFDNVNNDYILTKEYVQLILQEYNYDLAESKLLTSKNVYDELKVPINPNSLVSRPPVVTIMGHVDHGKTTIIDYLRKSSVVAQEHGGITQHIGAFQVITPVTKKKITFLDTPGHAAFLKMRERGALTTDIIVLVVSIEDSVMPQTLEAIKHIKKSGNELIVAITKIDKVPSPKERERKMEKIIGDLIAQGIMVEKVGGDVQVIPISAKTGENMDLFEESIISLGEIMDIKTENSKKTMVEGYIIESSLKNTVGNVATILIKKGTLQRGAVLLSGNTYCKVRGIVDASNTKLMKALPSEAVKVIGWKELPQAGDEVLQVKSEAVAKKYISKRLGLIETEKNAVTVKKYNVEKIMELERQKEEENMDEEELLERKEAAAAATGGDQGPKKVNFLIKADVSGSVEAIKESIEHLGNDEVQCSVVASSVGVPVESDLKMAEITNSQILCFNLENIPNDVMNNKQHIVVKRFNVIYKLIEDVVKTLEDNMKPMYEKKFVATVDIKEIFEYNLKKKILKIAGCKVSNGQISRNSKIQIVRGDDEKVIFEGGIATLKHGKDDVAVVTKGHECGITFDNNFEDYKAGDKILVYTDVKIERHL